MAIAIQNKEPDAEGLEFLGNMNRAIPGECLTANRYEPRSWERPPEFTTMKDALEHVLSLLIKEKTYVSIVGAIGRGVPISDVVQQILYIGFTKGKWNPDMMLLLVEPIIYLLMSLCEKAGMEYKLYRGEKEDEEDDDIEGSLSSRGKELQSLAKMIDEKAESGTITSASIPREIAMELKEVKVPESLMAKPQQEQELPIASNSLLAST